MFVGKLFAAEGGEPLILFAQPFFNGERAPRGAENCYLLHIARLFNHP